jgi:hypothetical protein
MNRIYTFSTKEFQPISFRDVYLYDCFGSIFQFLKSNKFSVEEINRLAKPELKANSAIEWYANYNGEFKSIDRFDASFKKKVLEEYGVLNDKVDRFCAQLKRMNTPDGKEWFELLSAVFDAKNVLLVSNGSDWVVIWGWRFNSLNVNYRVPEFSRVEATPIIEDQSDEKISTIQEISEEVPQPLDVPFEEPPVNSFPQENSIRYKLPWWRRVLRFLRWFTYRFWMLLLILALLPLLFCLVRLIDKWLCLHL